MHYVIFCRKNNQVRASVRHRLRNQRIKESFDGDLKVDFKEYGDNSIETKDIVYDKPMYEETTEDKKESTNNQSLKQTDSEIVINYSKAESMENGKFKLFIVID